MPRLWSTLFHSSCTAVLYSSVPAASKPALSSAQNERRVSTSRASSNPLTSQRERAGAGSRNLAAGIPELPLLPAQARAGVVRPEGRRLSTMRPLRGISRCGPCWAAAILCTCSCLADGFAFSGASCSTASVSGRNSSGSCCPHTPLRSVSRSPCAKSDPPKSTAAVLLWHHKPADIVSSIARWWCLASNQLSQILCELRLQNCAMRSTVCWAMMYYCV